VSFFFLNSGYNSAHYNMALDEYLLHQSSGTCLRVYGWSIPAISFGFGQTADQELDIHRLLRNKFHFVRRLTGGRAVLHDAEITYSLTADIGGLFGHDLNSAYHAISFGLKTMLEQLGVSCELEKGTVPDKREKTAASLPCFASTARHELKVNGRKIIGSAQRREKNRFLQHGSLILENRLDITDYLKLDEKGKKRYKALLSRQATSLTDAAKQDFSYDTLAAAFKQGFSKAWRMKAEDYAIGEKGCEAIRILEAKYFSDEWNRAAAAKDASKE